MINERPSNLIPKGQLILIGGHEDKGDPVGENLKIHLKNKSMSHFEILGMLISRIPRAHHIIEIIATASQIETEMEDLYKSSFKQEGFTHVGIIKVNNETDANNSDSIQRIKGAHAVFFTGGDQQKLIAILAKTELLTTIKRKYLLDKHFIVGGTSAGAMVIPETCIAHGTIREALFKNDITIVEGFGLIGNVIVDTHFVKRGRFARLAQAVTMHPTCLGIGLEENTAIIISQGYKVECIGSGMVTLIDGSKLTKTNVNAVNDSTPIIMNNLKVSILAKGSKLLLKKINQKTP